MSHVAQEPGKHTGVKQPFKLRLWPAVVITILMLAAGYISPRLPFDNPGLAHLAQLLVPATASLALVIWWLFLSHVSRWDGWGVLGFAAACYVGTFFIADSTMGLPLILSALPRMIVVGVLWLTLSMRLRWPTRRVGLSVAMLLTCCYYTLLRFEGISGEFALKMSYRWEKTAEEEYMASREVRAEITNIGCDEMRVLTATDNDWVAFRGKHGTSVYGGPPISEDWSSRPPKLLWKRRIGPGWGSFVVVDRLGFTQEQRDQQEVVTAFDIDTGEPVWEFAEDARFEESMSGAGPRATPLFHEGRLYTVGATGRLNCLDAASGEKLWNASIVSGNDVAVPQWGYSCSPIIVGDAVVTMPGNPDGAAVTAFDGKTGVPLWAVADGEHSYTSAQAATICGIPLVLAFTSVGLMGIEPDTGNMLWMHEWPSTGYARCVQPYVEDDTVVISTYFGLGMRKVKVTKEGDIWKDDIVWESKELKPYYNDMVVSRGHAYGFDSNIFCCLDLATGKRKWKGGRYGCGQVLLLEEQRKLLVLSERGDVVLLDATPHRHVECARFQAISGKTWNHPVVAHERLFVRNSEVMACFDVSRGVSDE